MKCVHWHMQKNKYNQSILVINKRPWFNVHKEYAAKYNIDLLQVKIIIFLRREHLHNFLRSNLILYRLARYIKYKHWTNANIITKYSNQLYIEGRGDVNLEKKGYHSDFFWHLNSNYPAKNILYKYHSNFEKNYLEKKGINAVSEGIVYENKITRNYRKPQVQVSSTYKDESADLNTLLESYDLDRYYWGNFFKKYSVKIYLTWFKNSCTHMAIADAVKDNGGIAVLWQLSFAGTVGLALQCDFDISFCYSKFSHQMDTESRSNIRYTIITGYQRESASSIVRKEAVALRNQLLDHGAKKIVLSIDENSNDDSRWHTGHILQRENYSYILEKLLEIPWLGVIFKPKNAKSLRVRLGSVNKLLEKAEKTGRCYVYENTGKNTTITPPVLAGLSSDICISGHLSAGTAALECALEGMPTLLIDREGTPASKLNELPVGKVIFKDWPSTIDAIMEHFKTPEGISGFGDWSSIIDEIDPFRDGLAAKRIGDYLHWLIQGYDQNQDKETCCCQMRCFH